MNGVKKIPASYDDWYGENVSILLKDGSVLNGFVKAAKNSALILLPHSGKKLPAFIPYSDIAEITAESMDQETLPPVTLQTVRTHMFKFHAFNAPWSTSVDLLKLHEKQHQEDIGAEIKTYGHTHRI